MDRMDPGMDGYNGSRLWMGGGVGLVIHRVHVEL